MLSEKNNLRSSLLDATTPRQGQGRNSPRPPNPFNKIKSQITAAMAAKIADELVQREVYIAPTKWNKTKLFFANFYETFLIILGLALSIYQEDASSFVFQVLMQVVLYYAHRNMGAHVVTQKKICLGTLIVIALIMASKVAYMVMTGDNLNEFLTQNEEKWSTYGYNFKLAEDGVTQTWDKWRSLEFETFAIILCFLLIRHYNGRILSMVREEPYQLVMHSMWLGMNKTLYHAFFVLLTVDTFFAQNFIQMTVLALMLLIMFAWAVEYRYKETLTRKAVIWCIRLYTIQLAILALCQITPVYNYIKAHESLHRAMFLSGLILNQEPMWMAVTHIFLICFILGFGSLYENTNVNYNEFKKHEKEFADPQLTETLLRKKSLENKKIKAAEHPDEESPVKRKRFSNIITIHSSISKFNVEKFVATYLPYVCLWAIRILSVVYSYAYHGYPAFIILTWVLASFMTPALPFVNCTTHLYLPLFTAGFFFTYFINIPQLFELTDDGRYFKNEFIYTFGRHYQFAVVEICGMALNIIFMILLMSSRNDLRLQRDEFRVGIFEKLSDKKSVFLWQLFFYVLKRLHVVLLSLIFIFFMKEFNIYYIGLLYFFVRFTSSLQTYRKSGIILVAYAAFFIWIQYFWSLISNQFDPQGVTYRLLTMLTIQKYKDPKDEGIGKINQFLEYDMPIGQWIILMLQILMYTVNRFFMTGKPHRAKSLENPAITIDYPSMGEYYEDKCDFVLRKKFPSFAKVLIRLRRIFSEMMIIAILITQGFILVLQPPNLMFWGFLIFSLTLQTAVVSASEENPQMLRKCAGQSKILKIYSGFVLIAQIAYHFINDKSFLAQYGFDEILNYILGDLNEYMTIIGFENYQNSKRSIFEIFVSQILFYITACILEDYFLEKLEQLENQYRLAQEPSNVDGRPMVYNPDQPFDKSHSVVGGRQTLANNQSLRQSTAMKDLQPEEDDFFKENEKEKINFDFERIRFSIPYMIYQRLPQWRIMDSIAMNFHLVTATVTIILCTNWQISLFMSFYLLCNVILCIRAAKELHSNGQKMKAQDIPRGNSDLNSSMYYDENRNNIDSFMINGKDQEIDVDAAHRMNKEYMHYASKILLSVRVQQWTYQYWLLIISMIIMYPTPILTDLKDKMTPDQRSMTDTSIFWLFWSGIYVAPGNNDNIANHAPLYVMLILLIIEKSAQRWQENRYGLSLEKVTEFKTLEEQLKLIKNEKEPKQINTESIIPKPVPLSEFITISEAQQECDRVETLFREQTEEIIERRLKQTLENGIKRKYTIKFRNGMKIVMEQISLQLLLFSCANKSNIVSVLYLGLLLTFLLIKNKTTGMLYMSYVFGITLALEYICSLTNLTSLNNPMPFPAPYNEGYPSKEIPEGQFVFPWFLKVDFFKENLHWAHFFSIDIINTQVNDIWFDFANLVILTIYFFNYGNPINAKNIKVSFSQTKSLETALYDYARIQVNKKYKLKFPEDNRDSSEIEDKGDEPKIDSDKMAEKAADNSLEYFMGATHYLKEIKQNTFIYYFTKKARYFSFIGLQIVTLIMTFLLAILCRSLMSIGYMVFCVPLIMQITDFFHLDKLHHEKKQWRHPIVICGPLMMFSFVDIALQIFCQAPLYSGTYFFRQFGFDKVYTINTEVTFEELLYPVGAEPSFLSLSENGQSLMFLILKSLNLFFIFLQSRIYESDSFWQFMREDLRRLHRLATSYKRMAMTYRYNNWKLQKIVTVQQRKQKMYEGVAELRVKMAHYQRAQQSLINGNIVTKPQATLRQPLLDKIDEEDHKSGDNEAQADPSYEPTLNKASSSKTINFSERRKTINNMVGKQFSFQHFQDLLKQDDLYFEKQDAFKKMKTKLGRCGKWYLRLHKNHVNPIVFINDIEEATRVKNTMAQGKRKINSDLERVMLQDIDKFYQMKKNNTIEKKVRRKIGVKIEEDEIQLKDMPKTLEFLRIGNMLPAIIGAILKAIFSKSSTIAYVFMILSQILNAGLISILLPFAVFGYALMEECRPGMWFWRIIKMYVLAILFLKFFINLDFLADDQGLVDTYTSINNWVLFGLWRVEGIWNLLVYVLPEVIILVAIMGQSYYEILLGLYDKRETDFENIEEARERFLQQFNNGEQEEEVQVVKPKNKLLQEEEDSPEEEHGFTYEERLANYRIELRQIKLETLDVKIRKARYDDVIDGTIQIQKGRKELSEEIQKFQTFERKYSLIVDIAERRQVIKELKAKRPENQGIVRNYFSKQSYFRRLFPKVKEQKPGIDLYGKITFVQFVICIYLISYYTKLDARGTQNLENSSQFSIYMVVMLFIQVIVMILERYISRTNTRVNLQRARGGKKDDLDDKLMSKMSLGDAPRSLSMHLQAQKTGDTILFGSDKRSKNVTESREILSINLQHTRMTTQQVMKWIVQWVLLILYHALVFWIFPLSSNDAIYGTPYCNKESQLYGKYGCLSFNQNWYLIIFYMIFCWYFMLSALQIRYGYPDFKEPSSLTSKDGTVPVLLYRVFYVLPFMLELKTILDWCFQKTSLDLFQWLELVEIDSELFFFKNGNKGYFQRKLGTKISRFEKCLCGCFCLGTILFFLVGPFFMFSNLSIIASENLVTDAQIRFNMKLHDLEVEETYEFPIFDTDKPISMRAMSEREFESRGYNLLPETKFFEPSQVQLIKMKNSSDTEWSVSGGYKNQFKEMLGKFINEKEQKSESTVKAEMDFMFAFDRNGPDNALVAKGWHNRTLDNDDERDVKVIQQLYAAMSIDCEANPSAISNIRVENFIPYQLRLGEKKEVIDLNLDKENVTLSYSCENYWALNVNKQGLLFITFSDLISDNLFDATSILGFYFGVAVIVGQTLRKIVMFDSDRIIITEIPDPDPIRNLIKAIYMQRLEQNLKKEEELWFILIEILRSPEMIKAICGSSLRAPLVQKKPDSQPSNLRA